MVLKGRNALYIRRLQIKNKKNVRAPMQIVENSRGQKKNYLFFKFFPCPMENFTWNFKIKKKKNFGPLKKTCKIAKKSFFLIFPLPHGRFHLKFWNKKKKIFKYQLFFFILPPPWFFLNEILDIFFIKNL